MAKRKKTELMQWMDAQLEGDPVFARAVERRMVEMRAEQEVFALRGRANAACRPRTERARASLVALRDARGTSAPGATRDLPLEVRRRLFREFSAKIGGLLREKGITEEEVLRDFEDFKRRRREGRGAGVS